MSKQESAFGCGTMFAIIFIIGMILSTFSDKNSTTDSEIDDIIRAKEVVKSQLNYPDTATFDMFYTRVTPTHVHLKVTAKNAFGVPSTHTFKIPR